MKNIMLLALLSLPILSLAQNDQTVEDILEQNLDVFYRMEFVDLDSLQREFYKLNSLGLDSIDTDLKMMTLLATVFLEKSRLQVFIEPEFKKTLIKEVVDTLHSYRKNEGFLQVKKWFADFNKINQKFASRQNWESITRDKYIEFLQVNSDIESQLSFNLREEYIYKQFEKDGDELHKSYKTLYDEYEVYVKERYHLGYLIDENPKDINLLPNMDLEKELNNIEDTVKPIIIFFNSYYCNSTRKFNITILRDPIVFEKILNDFHFINLYVDEKDNVISFDSISGEKVYPCEILLRTDNKNAQLQLGWTGSELKTGVVIIDKNKNIINEPFEYIGIEKSYDFYEYLEEAITRYKIKDYYKIND